MENNIFESAKFGDKFLTRNGRKAILITKEQYRLAFVIEGIEEVISFFIDGISMDGNYEIISRYQEPVDMAKLDYLIEISVPKNPFFSTEDYDKWDDGYKAGYKQRVKEEN